VTGMMLIYTSSRECEEVSDFFQFKIGLFTSNLGITLTKISKYRPSQLMEYQKELKDLFAMHLQRVFHRFI
jgi:predicted HTH domain antitoxin